MGAQSREESETTDPASTSTPTPDEADPESGEATEAQARPPLPVEAAPPLETEYSVPDPVEPRPYIEIRPSETTVDPTAVRQAMDLLHALLADLTKTGLRHSIFGSSQVPLVEWLLVADGRDDPQIRYLVGTTYSDMTEDLQGILRTCFPNSYEFRHVEWHPRFVEEFLPIPDPIFEPASTPTVAGEALDTTVHPYVAGVEYRGHTSRRRDWQTPLKPFGQQGTIGRHGRAQRSAWRSPQHDTASNGHTGNYQHGESHRVPLASLIETMRDARVPVVYQLVCRVHDDWTSRAELYLKALDEGQIGFLSGLREFLAPSSREERQAYKPPLSDRNRIEGIESRDPQRTFCVSARAVALTRDDPYRVETVARRLRNALSGTDGQYHTIQGHPTDDSELHTGTEPPGTAVFTDLCSRAVYPVTYESFSSKFPGKTPQSTGIVVAPAELPGLCLVDGTGLTPNGQRALDTRRRERTALALPPPQQLARYRPPGMALCMPLTHDRQPYGQALYLRPTQQDRHLVVVGDTGAGKSVLLEGAVLTNAAATAGPEIVFDYKGGGTAEEYLRIHYAAHGSLEDVLYFDLSRVLPAFSFFDIEPLLAAGLPREEARSRKAGHYEEILAGVMGAEKYGEAAESVKAIRNHLRALYDPVHGTDAVSQQDLYDALQRSQRGGSMPPTTDEKLTAYFEGLAERDRDIFNKVLGGAVGRVETIATDGRLAPVFDHTPDRDETAADSTDTTASTAAGDTATFDFADQIDEDTVVVFDFGGMEGTVKRTLTLVVLSNLWTALKAREQRARRTGERDLPQVNLYLEEARDVGSTRLLDTLLAEGRSFGLSIALGVQFPEQLDSSDPERDTYREALNETATFVVGNVSVDTDLPQVLATEAMDPESVSRRLSSMGRGEWLVRPGSEFGEEPVKPFLAESLPAPAGHPASSEPLTGHDERAFRAAFERVKRESAVSAGLSQYDPDWDTQEASEAIQEPEDEDTDEIPVDGTRLLPSQRVDTLLGHTQRMPECVRFDAETDALCCRSCNSRYDLSIEGMVRAIECCHSLDAVDRDDVPVCECNLKLSPAEINAAEWSLKQLLFVQVVYNAQQLRYDPLEYDLLWDSMLRLQEYVGIDTDEIQELLDADLVRHDTDHPHRLYSVSSSGRKAIGESYREGIDYGHGKGDLEESSEHVFGVALGTKYLEEHYRADPDSAVEVVRPYHELRKGTLPASAFMGDDDDAAEATDGYEQRRLDVAGLDSEGNVVVTIEVERINNDYHRAIPADFDKMAACEPEEAIWIVMSRKDGHTIVQTLNDPIDGPTRVEKTYSENTPLQHFSIDTPGLTEVYPVGYVRDQLSEDRL